MIKFIFQTPIPPVEVSGEGPPPPESSEGPPLSDQRIVGGYEAEPYKRGYQVLFRTSGSYCGGVVFSELFVLTAAHCIPGKNRRMTVTVGIHDLKVKESFTQVIPVAKAFLHPDYYGGRGITNDIAVLKLEQKIKMTVEGHPLPPIPSSDQYNGVLASLNYLNIFQLLLRNLTSQLLCLKHTLSCGFVDLSVCSMNVGCTVVIANTEQDQHFGKILKLQFWNHISQVFPEADHLLQGTRRLCKASGWRLGPPLTFSSCCLGWPK
nr:trypsin-like [Penaeus vannamei]